MQPKRVELGLPFAFIGAAAVALITVLSSGQARGPTRIVLATLAIALPGCLGWVGRRASRHGHADWVGFAFLACELVGFATALLEPEPLHNGALWLGMGRGLALFFLVVLPLAGVTRAAQDAQEARAGSLAARSELRFVIAIGLLVLDLYLVFACVFAWHHGAPWLAWSMIAASAGSKLFFVGADLLLARRIRALGALPFVELGPGTAARERIDLGVGSTTRGTPPAAAGYREAPISSLLVVGDAEASALRVRRRTTQYLRLIAIAYAPVWLPALATGAAWIAAHLAPLLAR